MSNIAKLYRECRDLCGWIVGKRAIGALQQAKAVAVALDASLEVTWESEQDSGLWDYGNVGDWITEDAWKRGVESGRYEVLCALIKTDCGQVLASVGGCIVDNRDSKARAEYMRGTELDLLSEAGHVLMKGGY